MWSCRRRAPAKHAPPPRVTWAPNRNNSSTTAGSSNTWPFRAPSRLHSKNGWRGIRRGGRWNISTWSNSPCRASHRQELHQHLASHRKLHRTSHQTCFVCDLETAPRFRKFGAKQNSMPSGFLSSAMWRQQWLYRWCRCDAAEDWARNEESECDGNPNWCSAYSESYPQITTEALHYACSCMN